MPYREFSFESALEKLGLELTEAEMFADAASPAIRDELLSRLSFGHTLAAAVDTEKARSEFIVAPILLELKRELGQQMAVFSGVEFNVDASRGLTGVCDFLLSRSPIQHTIRAPIAALVEAKNEDLRAGFGQCIAEMVAAQVFNQRAGSDLPTVYGAVTSGNLWKFLRLTGATVTIDPREHLISDPGRIMGILRHIILAG